MKKTIRKKTTRKKTTTKPVKRVRKPAPKPPVQDLTTTNVLATLQRRGRTIAERPNEARSLRRRFRETVRVWGGRRGWVYMKRTEEGLLAQATKREVMSCTSAR